MEELIEKADSTESVWGNLCFFTAFIGIGISGLVISLSFGDPQLRGIGAGFGGLGGSIGIGAVGSTANNSKRSAALLKLLVQSTNSASELPINEKSKPEVFINGVKQED